MDESDDLFEKRLLELQDSLLNYAYMLTKDKELAKDLLQDTLMKALDNRDKYVSNINLYGWASTIMRNIFINNYRRDICHKTMIDQTEDLYHLNLPQESGFEMPDSSYTIEDINRAISSLTYNSRIALSMFIVGYKYSDIATALNISVGTVKSRIFMARQRLQILLKDYR